MTLKVRRLPEREIPRVAEFLIERFHAEFAAELPPLNRPKVVATVYGVWKDGFILVAEEDDAIVASIGVIASAPWFSDEAHPVDVWTYLAPEARGGPVRGALLDAASRLAADRWQRMLRIGASVGGRHEAKDRLMRRHGFRRVASLYEREE
jgi:GNAT superfamily N-acetyltransferase